MPCVHPDGPFSSALTFGLTATDQPGFDMYGPSVPASTAKSLGERFAASYLSNSPGKDWTSAAVHAYEADGLGVVAVWESGATNALGGYSQGVADASVAKSEAASLGEPAARPIFFAVDTDTSWLAVSRYFAGVDHILGTSRVGIYGGYSVVSGAVAAHAVSHVWQTIAWSSGQWSSSACLRQTSINDVLGGAYSVDDDLATCADYGQFNYVAPKPPAPSPSAAEEYQNYPDQAWILDGQTVRERATVETWDLNGCVNPVHREVCVTTRQHLVLLQGRLIALAAQFGWGYGSPVAIGLRNQELYHREIATRPILTWGAGL